MKKKARSTFLRRTISCSFAFVEVIEDSQLPPISSTIDADIEAFVQSCLVCTLSSSGSKVPRPLGQQMHAQHLSELLHFDFLYVEESRTGHGCILNLKDDFSGYVFLRPCKKEDAEATGNLFE